MVWLSVGSHGQSVLVKVTITCAICSAFYWTRLCFVHSYRSILQLVKPWYDEVKDYSFPYPRDCNPRCPLRCYGPMCTHYTQVETWLELHVIELNCCSSDINSDSRLFCFVDGVGNIQQSRLCCSHVPQYECMGFSVETCYVFSVQLLTQVSITGKLKVNCMLFFTQSYTVLNTCRKEACSFWWTC